MVVTVRFCRGDRISPLVAHEVLIWLAVALLVVAGPAMAASALPTAPAAQSTTADPDALRRQAQAALTNAQRYDTDTCSAAMPLFDQAIAAARSREAHIPGYSADRSMGYAMLQQGYCKAATRHDAEAVALFLAVAHIGETMPDMATYAPMARACLADAYALGRGVPVDRERALAQYALSEKTSCRVGDRDPAFEASEIVRALNPLAVRESNSLVYHFLHLGSAKDWWRATQLLHPDDSRFGVDDIQLMMRGLEAGGETPDDDHARSSLNLTLGKALMDRYQTTAALGYLQAANSDAARALIAGLVGKQSYNLVIGPDVKTTLPDAH